MKDEPGGLQSMGSQESDTTWRLKRERVKYYWVNMKDRVPQISKKNNNTNLVKRVQGTGKL